MGTGPLIWGQGTLGVSLYGAGTPGLGTRPPVWGQDPQCEQKDPHYGDRDPLAVPVWGYGDRKSPISGQDPYYGARPPLHEHNVLQYGTRDPQSIPV